jgi:hypothetical protein
MTLLIRGSDSRIAPDMHGPFDGGDIMQYFFIADEVDGLDYVK